jgi:hypothetical protein
MWRKYSERVFKLESFFSVHHLDTDFLGRLRWIYWNHWICWSFYPICESCHTGWCKSTVRHSTLHSIGRVAQSLGSSFMNFELDSGWLFFVHLRQWTGLPRGFNIFIFFILRWQTIWQAYSTSGHEQTRINCDSLSTGLFFSAATDSRPAAKPIFIVFILLIEQTLRSSRWECWPKHYF